MPFFPLLRLPLVALRNVTDCWNPIELFHFSKVSGKTKKIAISQSKIPQKVEVWYGHWYVVRLEYENKDHEERSFVFNIGFVDPFMIENEAGKWRNMTEMSIPSKNPSTEITFIVEEILELFKCSIWEICLFDQTGTYHEFENFILWINSLKQEILPLVHFDSSDILKLRIFLTTFEKETEDVTIDSTFFNPETLMGPLEFTRGKFNFIQFSYGYWLGLEELMVMDFVEADLKSTLFTNETINLFLKSFMEGDSHERMKTCVFNQSDGICMRTILKGVSMENQEAFDYNQVKGNLKIQGQNMKIAEIEFNRDTKQFCITVL